MFTLKKAITPFLLPPGLIILLAFGVFVFSVSRRRKNAARVSFGLGLALWLCSISPTADWIVGSLESGLAIPQAPKGDVIIVLGAGTQNTPDMSGGGTLNSISMERVVTAARLQQHLGIPVMVSGGEVDTASPAFAPIAKRILNDLGVPAGKVILDTQSRDTYENAHYSQILCHQKKLKQPILVTTASHMKRALYSFQSVGLNATPFPCGFTVDSGQPFHWRQLLPTAVNLYATSTGLHEWLGRVYYWMKY